MFLAVILAPLAALVAPLLPHYLQHVFSADPLVTLDYGTFSGGAQGGVAAFLTSLRFMRPQLPLPLSGVQSAKDFGPSCPSQTLTVAPGINLPRLDADFVSEDCLSINVYKPTDTPAGAKLPVLFSIHGGGFAAGTASSNDGGVELVNRSIAVGHPILYVSANYRTNAFGFLASKELYEEGSMNNGLHDQRMALQWVQKYVALFGGDPDKVVVRGQSAGSISIGLHLVANGGDPQGLFRGALMQSGAHFHLRDHTDGQHYYDLLALHAGCAAAEDTLACLRHVPLDELMRAVNEVPNLFGYESVRSAWQPRKDDVLFTEDAFSALIAGRYAKVPFISGDDDDEGTMFSLSSLNVTTDEEFLEYARFIAVANDAQAVRIAEAYYNDPAQGSPFDTGDAWQLSPQYKRIAAFQGDWIFQAPRRFMLKSTNGTQKTWSYLYKRGKGASAMGSAHCTSCSLIRMGPKWLDLLINFVHNLDPNQAVSEDSKPTVMWPEWGSSLEGELMTYSDPDVVTITQDTFREKSFNVLNDISLEMAREWDRRGL